VPSGLLLVVAAYAVPTPINVVFQVLDLAIVVVVDFNFRVNSIGEAIGTFASVFVVRTIVAEIVTAAIVVVFLLLLFLLLEVLGVVRQ